LLSTHWHLMSIAAVKVLSLSELCEKMHKRGYQFARLAQVTPPPGADAEALLLQPMMC
jgi:hypothetical protein